MKNLKVPSMVLGGVLSLVTSGLLAQQSATSTSPSSSSGLDQSSSSSSLGSRSTGANSSALDSSSSKSMHGGANMRLSQILNSPVQSQDGKTLGYLRDVTVDPRSGRIEFGIVSLSSAGASTDTSTSGRETAPSSRSSISGTPSSTSGYSATGKLIPVPWQMFRQSWGGGHSHGASSSSSSSSGTISGSETMGAHNLVLNVDESKLRSAPSFDASNWNELQGGSFEHRAYSYFGVDRSSGTGTSGSSLSGHGTSGTLDQNSRGSSTSPHDSSNTSPQDSSSSSSSPSPK